MTRVGVVSFILLSLTVTSASDAVAATNYAFKHDSQAVAIAQAAFAAMSGGQAVAGYQDSVASGTVTRVT
jgi:hypothetical protein